MASPQALARAVLSADRGAVVRFLDAGTPTEAQLSLFVDAVALVHAAGMGLRQLLLLKAALVHPTIRWYMWEASDILHRLLDIGAAGPRQNIMLLRLILFAFRTACVDSLRILNALGQTPLHRLLYMHAGRVDTEQWPEGMLEGFLECADRIGGITGQDALSNTVNDYITIISGGCKHHGDPGGTRSQEAIKNSEILVQDDARDKPPHKSADSGTSVPGRRKNSNSFDLAGFVACRRARPDLDATSILVTMAALYRKDL